MVVLALSDDAHGALLRNAVGAAARDRLNEDRDRGQAVGIDDLGQFMLAGRDRAAGARVRIGHHAQQFIDFLEAGRHIVDRPAGQTGLQRRGIFHVPACRIWETGVNGIFVHAAYHDLGETDLLQHLARAIEGLCAQQQTADTLAAQAITIAQGILGFEQDGLAIVAAISPLLMS